jgi:hypothetical protein
LSPSGHCSSLQADSSTTMLLLLLQVVWVLVEVLLLVM